MKAGRVALILGVIVLIGLGALAAWFLFRPAHFDFAKLGGTVLVYDVEPRDPQEGDVSGITAEALQRRLDPDDRGLAQAKPLGKNRVEIRLTRTSDKHAENLARAKDIIMKVGDLEFRILANAADDAKAIQDAADQLNAAAQADKDGWAEKGVPPPGPRKPGSQELEVYEIALPGNNKSLVTYGWVELGPQERLQNGLDDAAGKDPTQRGAAWREAEARRNRASKLPDPHSPPGAARFLLQGGLIYSRVCQNRDLPEADRTAKGIEYFALSRHPEIDAKDPQKKQTPRVDGRYLVSVIRDSSQGRPSVAFSLNAIGADLFGNLTRKNVPSGAGAEEAQVRRHLAIILDGRIMTSPTINSEIRSHGQISGNFAQTEVENLVNILRSGALPASLKPVPVSETEVAPGK